MADALYNPLTPSDRTQKNVKVDGDPMRVCTQEAEIGPFLIDLTTGRVLRDGTDLGLRPQACRVFKALLQNRGQYVDYEHMIVEAWHGTVVSRHTVDVTVGEVKKVLQEFGSWIT